MEHLPICFVDRVSPAASETKASKIRLRLSNKLSQECVEALKPYLGSTPSRGQQPWAKVAVGALLPPLVGAHELSFSHYMPFHGLEKLILGGTGL